MYLAHMLEDGPESHTSLAAVAACSAYRSWEGSSLIGKECKILWCLVLFILRMVVKIGRICVLSVSCTSNVDAESLTGLAAVGANQRISLLRGLSQFLDFSMEGRDPFCISGNILISGQESVSLCIRPRVYLSSNQLLQ